jgi:hypothetical protein
MLTKGQGPALSVQAVACMLAPAGLEGARMNEIVIVMPALFGSVVWLAYIVVDGFRRRQQLRVVNEFHNKLLDRIGSASDFVEFFNSEAGTRFLESLSTERGAPAARIVSALQWGLTMVTVGVAVFILLGNRPFEEEVTDALTFVATLAVGLGAGMVLSSAVSYVAAGRMGILRRPGSTS